MAVSSDVSGSKAGIDAPHEQVASIWNFRRDRGARHPIRCDSKYAERDDECEGNEELNAKTEEARGLRERGDVHGVWTAMLLEFAEFRGEFGRVPELGDRPQEGAFHRLPTCDCIGIRIAQMRLEFGKCGSIQRGTGTPAGNGGLEI